MKDGERNEFCRVMARVMAPYNQTVTDDLLDAWWAMMQPYSLEQVKQALHEHVANSVYTPKPADVIQRLQQADGRPGTEEAWSIAQAAGDEDCTVVWTHEMAGAFSAAQPVLAEGDAVGARMAFRESYEKLVSAARAAGTPVVWTVSLGHDKHGRLGPVREAYEAGRISHNQALACLPTEDREEIAPEEAVLEHHAPEISDEQREENRRRLRELIEDTPGRKATDSN